jgi:hypothetical protein
MQYIPGTYSGIISEKWLMPLDSFDLMQYITTYIRVELEIYRNKWNEKGGNSLFHHEKLYWNIWIHLVSCITSQVILGYHWLIWDAHSKNIMPTFSFVWYDAVIDKTNLDCITHYMKVESETKGGHNLFHQQGDAWNLFSIKPFFIQKSEHCFGEWVSALEKYTSYDKVLLA